MTQSVLEMAKELSLALIETGNVPAEDMQDTLQTTHTTLLTLKAQEAGTTAVPSVVTTASDWRTSITRHSITCLECGANFKQLSGLHLRLHGLDTRSYRDKYGIPRTQPLMAQPTTAKRNYGKRAAIPERPTADAEALPLEPITVNGSARPIVEPAEPEPDEVEFC